ncbi:MAG: M48 family metalloprotease [Gammaproteobacteria bacterium]
MPSQSCLRSRWPRKFTAAVLSLLLAASPAGALEDSQPLTEHDDIDLNDLPDFGDSAGAYISPEQERLLGLSFMRQMRRQAPIVTDEEVEDYIQKVGMELGEHSGYYGDFHFFVIESSVINAFAVPGGYIGMHSGLILNSQSESEMASVLAHEIAHLTQRHGARMIEAAGKMSIPSMAAFLGAIILSAIDPQAGMGALAAIGAAQQQYQLNFTRANEKEADRLGIELLNTSGFNTESMAVFFERMQLANRYSDPAYIPEYLRSHPVTVNRIAEARERAEKMPSRTVREDSYDYLLVWQKLNVMSAADPAQAKTYYEATLRDRTYKNEAATRYGYALALSEAGDFDRARRELDQLILAQPNITAFRIAYARLEQQAGRLPRALALFDEARKLDPESRAATYGYVSLLSHTGQPEEARRILREFGSAERRDPRFYKLLAEAEERMGDVVNSHYDLAEYYRAVGEVELAAEQLKLAQTVADISHYQRMRVDARLAELEKDLDRMDAERAKRRQEEERDRRRRSP